MSMKLADIINEVDSIRGMQKEVDAITADPAGSLPPGGTLADFATARALIDKVVQKEYAIRERWAALTAAVEGRPPQAKTPPRKPVVEAVRAQIQSWLDADLKEEEYWDNDEWRAWAKQHKLNGDSVIAAVKREARRMKNENA